MVIWSSYGNELTKLGAGIEKRENDEMEKRENRWNYFVFFEFNCHSIICSLPFKCFGLNCSVLNGDRYISGSAPAKPATVATYKLSSGMIY